MQVRTLNPWVDSKPNKDPFHPFPPSWPNSTPFSIIEEFYESLKGNGNGFMCVVLKFKFLGTKGLKGKINDPLHLFFFHSLWFTNLKFIFLFIFCGCMRVYLQLNELWDTGTIMGAEESGAWKKNTRIAFPATCHTRLASGITRPSELLSCSCMCSSSLWPISIPR
jgi:hypothetical protein